MFQKKRVWSSKPEMRDHEVEAAVVVEVVEDGAAGQPVHVDAGLLGHVVEARQRVVRGEDLGRNQVALGGTPSG